LLSFHAIWACFYWGYTAWHHTMQMLFIACAEGIWFPKSSQYSTEHHLRACPSKRLACRRSWRWWRWRASAGVVMEGRSASGCRWTLTRQSMRNVSSGEVYVQHVAVVQDRHMSTGWTVTCDLHICWRYLCKQIIVTIFYSLY